MLIEHSFEDMDVNSILINNKQGAYDAVEYLIGIGHRRIAHITGNMNRKVALERLNGYVTAMQQYGIPIPNQYIAYNFSEDKYQAGIQLSLIHICYGQGHMRNHEIENFRERIHKLLEGTSWKNRSTRP